MDCEGYEYNLLEDDVLEKIVMIQMEYHYGYRDLKEKLEGCGFSVRYTEPRKGKVMELGFIYAERSSTAERR